MVMERIFDPIPDCENHQFFWNAAGIEGGAKSRDLSITSADKALNATGRGDTPTYDTLKHSARDSHYWCDVRGVKTGKID